MKEDQKSARLPCITYNLGRRAYPGVLDLQHELVRAKHEHELCADVLLLVEHEPVFTLGRQGRRDSLLVAEDFLLQQGIQVQHIERGGDITYHGPGQLVAYLILDLRRAGLRVTSFVAGMEEVMCKTARDAGVQAAADTQNRGVWVDGRKLGSLGVAIRHGITFHGLALNVSTDLTPFSYINPCGLSGVQMTSLEAETGTDQDFSRITTCLGRHMQEVFSLDCTLESRA
ncbi:lipoyl(octanoyl) transferase LipB [Desulfovermiculus halophilus]|jgi:lipoate-protein ligase B|uniref:lipoyl(octanoyl) transferase LipB n=1 Tax=Desulfovermiculus halophilus TaxID=339722 RepID=UPI000A0132E9|nr:lipoyl(octanoyl) transferase LipB [Desulfovermiculus halophilus]